MSDERVVALLEMADAKHEIDKLRHQQEVARQQLERQSMSAAAKEGSAVESLRESVKAMHAKCRDSDERASKAEAAAAAMQEEVRAAREAVAVAETRAAKEAKEAAVARAALEAMDAETVDSTDSVRQASAEAAEAEAAAAAAEEEAKRADVDLAKRKGEHLPRGNMRSSFASIREEEGAGEEEAAPPSRPAAPAAPSSVAPSSVAPIARESDVQGEGDDSTTASPRRRQVSLMRRSVSFRDDVVATARAHAQSLARVSGGYRDYEQSATVKQQSAQVFEFLTTLATSESGGHGDAGRGAGPAVSGGVIGAFATVLWSAQESAQREEVNMKEATMAYARMPHTASRQCRAKCRAHTHTHTQRLIQCRAACSVLMQVCAYTAQSCGGRGEGHGRWIDARRVARLPGKCSDSKLYRLLVSIESRRSHRGCAVSPHPRRPTGHPPSHRTPAFESLAARVQPPLHNAAWPAQEAMALKTVCKILDQFADNLRLTVAKKSRTPTPKSHRFPEGHCPIS